MVNKPMANKSFKIENMMKKRFFITQTGNIYGGTAGFYDYGYLGCSLRNNIINEWRKIFTRGQNIYEVDTSIILPEAILKASGHVDKFCDTLIFDEVNGECFRADHYLKDKVDQETEERLDVMTLDEINETIKKFNIKSPSGNKIGNAKHFNLMFKTHIGPQAQNLGYLRPETAQGQFLNFKKMYDLNSGKLPFGLFSIGKVFRNEISPRGGLLRVREFEQAEIEFFVDPTQKTHENYHLVQGIELKLHYGAETQETHLMVLEDAVKKKLIANECIAYFIGLTANFFNAIGIKNFRFRQHKKDEMAHYACDCWDAEVYTSQGWVEVVGIADRSCYDLTQHSKFSGSNLQAQRKLSQPRKVHKIQPILDRKNWGRKYKEKTDVLIRKIQNMKIDENNLTKKIEFLGEEIIIEYERSEIMIYKEDFLPSVIEPSFGIGRIFHALIEQNFWERPEDSSRTVISFSPFVAPYQVWLSSLVSKDFKDELSLLLDKFIKRGIRAHVIDQNASIGKRYASADEIGVSYFITFDPDTQTDHSVTIRERDSTKQIRIPIYYVVEKVCELIEKKELFES